MIMFYEFHEGGLVAGLATQHQHSLLKSCRGVAHFRLFSCDGSFGSTSKVRSSRESSITFQKIFWVTIFVRNDLPVHKRSVGGAFLAADRPRSVTPAAQMSFRHARTVPPRHSSQDWRPHSFIAH